MIALTADRLRDRPLPAPAAGSKEARGDVLAIGGSAIVPGAILLAGEAALRAGAGRLKIATARAVAPMLGLLLPEALVLGLEETADGTVDPVPGERLGRAAAHADAVLVGPGMLDQPATGRLAAAVAGLVPGKPMVLDAGALECLPQIADALRHHPDQVVITPHAGEMGALLGIERAEVEADPLEAGRRAAARLHCTVVMKGASTVVVPVEGEPWRFDGGTIALATSGSGDVLAGIVTGLLARGASAFDAALWGVFLHGEAGSRLARRMGGVGLLAREIAAEVPAIMNAVAANGRVPAKL